MSDLFDELMNEKNYVDAYIVAKNEYSRFPENKEAFARFVDLMLLLAKDSDEMSVALQYLDEANSALTLFSESSEISDRSILDFIKDYNSRIADVAGIIQERDAQGEEQLIKELRENNQKLFTRLSEIYMEIKNCTSQEYFDAMVNEISKVEESFEKDYFDDAQQNMYDKMTQSFSKLISDKMEDLNYQNLLEKNQTAVENLKSMFDDFNKKKALYSKSENELKGLLTKSMFCYDTRELFNETLIYYNHIYASIFNAVNDDLKFKMTKWSVTAEKKLDE